MLCINSLAVCLCVEIGLIGLVEEAWIVTLPTVDPDDVTYLDFAEEGRCLAQGLKQQVIFSSICFYLLHKCVIQPGNI